ncbi:MAG TPA: thiamine phosphate synthase [Blastocatellia bacterium]|jgi:thiamine-phosphate pyrophosphorylase|nr:thiamine phosphate synthase [Blastocatellia bacterium]
MLPLANHETLETSLIEFVKSAIKAGVDMVQIRERDLSAREVYSLIEAVMPEARARNAQVLVNDRADVAACASSGVHLTTSSMPARIVRAVFGSEMCMGVSTHDMDEALAAEQGGADFIVFGPVFETESKRAFGPPVGISALRGVAERVKIPVIALGGIKIGNFRQALAAGAAGIAAISLFAGCEDMSSLVKEIKDFASAG